MRYRRIINATVTSGDDGYPRKIKTPTADGEDPIRVPLGMIAAFINAHDATKVRIVYVEKTDAGIRSIHTFTTRISPPGGPADPEEFVNDMEEKINEREEFNRKG